MLKRVLMRKCYTMLTSVKWKIIMVRQYTNKITDSKTWLRKFTMEKSEKTISKPEDSGKLELKRKCRNGEDF